MGFRSNQFLNAPGFFSEQYTTITPDNEPFTYPDRIVRGLRKNASGSFEEYSETLDRGFIRNVPFGDTGNTPIRKCSFQFNPAKLRQVVEANTSMLNVLQQDPYQWAQPFGGDISFQFELLFDRSSELNNSTDVLADNIIDPDNINLWERYGPGQVGVLHDISVLASVIGLGISGSQAEYLKDLLRTRLESEISESQQEIINAAAVSSPGLTPDQAVEEVRQNALSKVDPFVGEAENISVNAGNSAFLIPLPVRAVFSSLYIVEGFVRNIDINFVKFTTKMVPMIASVVISMEAKYVGFAKRKTFFTESLSEKPSATTPLTPAQQTQASSSLLTLETETPTMTVAIVGKHVRSLNEDRIAFGCPLVGSSAGTGSLPLYSRDESSSEDYNTKDILRGVGWAVPDMATANKYEDTNRSDNNLLRSWVSSDGDVRFKAYMHVIRISKDVIDLIKGTKFSDSVSVATDTLFVDHVNPDEYQKLKTLYSLLGGKGPLGVLSTTAVSEFYRPEWYLYDSSVGSQPWEKFIPYVDGDPDNGDARSTPLDSSKLIPSYNVWSDVNVARTKRLLSLADTNNTQVPFNEVLDLASQICTYGTTYNGLQFFHSVHTLCEVYAGWSGKENRFTNPNTVEDFNRAVLMAFSCEDPEDTDVDIYFDGIDDQCLGGNSGSGGLASIVGVGGSTGYGSWDRVTPTETREASVVPNSTTSGHSAIYHLVRVYAGIDASNGGVSYKGEGYGFKLLAPGERIGEEVAYSDKARDINNKGFVESMNTPKGLMEVVPLKWRAS